MVFLPSMWLRSSWRVSNMRLVSALSGVWMWQLTRFGFCGGEIVGPGVWPAPLGINR